ncbi:methyl-accepting chemotaxis protein [Fluviispira vulneris]|uniref:methyl-accepting chemotaxis protein n=1 Tax=Fluviispira vulneris TaxID=2763012 RepID=UPI0016446245|nr:methyl-accepting chemotaxis protein [Fluviispira vulneris]
MFKRLSIKQKMIYWNILIIIIFAGILFFIMNNSLEHILKEKEIQIKHITEVSYGIIKKYIELEKEGKMTRKEAMEEVGNIIENARYDGTNYVFIDDIDQRQIVNPTRPEFKGQLQPTPPETMARLVNSMKQNKEGDYFHFFTKKPGQEGTFRKIAYVKPIPEWQWFVGTGTYINDIDEQRRDYIIELTAISVVITIFLMFGGIFFANLISVPLASLSARLLKSAANMEEKSKHLTQMSENVGNSSKGQASSIQETAAAIAEVTSMITRTSALTVQSGNLAHKISEGTAQGGEAVQRMVTSMEAIQESSQRLSDIEAIIKQIETKTMVINEIVTKTELLSLNASIEAARAGEYGKGFAVVAEEVGNLASTSGRSSNEIRDLLEKSRGSVQDILQMTVERVSEGQNKTIEVKTTFEKITADVNEINTQMTQITEATREQEIGVKQIASAMAKIDASAIQNTNSAEKSITASNDVFNISKDLKDIAHETEDIIFGEKKIENKKK